MKYIFKEGKSFIASNHLYISTVFFPPIAYNSFNKKIPLSLSPNISKSRIARFKIQSTMRNGILRKGKLYFHRTPCIAIVKNKVSIEANNNTNIISIPGLKIIPIPSPTIKLLYPYEPFIMRVLSNFKK